MAPNDAPLLLLVPALILFAWQLWIRLARVARYGEPQRLNARAASATLALAAVIIYVLLR